MIECQPVHFPHIHKDIDGGLHIRSAIGIGHSMRCGVDDDLVLSEKMAWNNEQNE
jgi:hypothetical protein